MAANPWHPRVAPFFCWIVFLAVTQFLPEPLAPAQPFIYIVQCVATVWLLWRYRHLTPELTLRFHWLAIPTGVFLLVAWVVLGYAMAGELGYRWERLMDQDWQRACGPFPYDQTGREPNRFGPQLNAEMQVTDTPIQSLMTDHPALGYLALGLRLLGMALIVPLFEELFIRSAMLRGLHRPGPTFTGLLQFGSDLPVVGDAIANSEAGRRANAQPPAFTRQLETTPLGAVTLFAIAASTLVFMLSHQLRDWPGCIACGVVWCWLVWHTNRGSGSEVRGSDSGPSLGLGPVIWSHGITNALLWLYTITWNDWRFL